MSRNRWLILLGLLVASNLGLSVVSSPGNALATPPRQCICASEMGEPVEELIAYCIELYAYHECSYHAECQSTNCE
jgi:hypothetical protein